MTPSNQPTELPSQEVLLELFRYEPDTGALYWRERSTSWFKDGYHSVETQAARWNARYADQPALMCRDENGYCIGAIFGRRASAHRVIWKMMTGEDPLDVDHINHEPGDNRWINLRSVASAENTRNQKRNSRNTTGVNGVWLDKKFNRFVARIQVNGRGIHLGRFDTIEEAAAARQAANARYGFHPNHGAPK